VGQWYASKPAVRPSTNVGRANNGNGPADCRNFGTTLFVLGCVVFTLRLSSGCGNKNVWQQAAPPPNVQVVEVMQRDVPVYHEYLLRPWMVIERANPAQVSGYSSNKITGRRLGSRNQYFSRSIPAFSAIVIKPRRSSHRPRRNLERPVGRATRYLRWQKKKQLRRSQLDNRHSSQFSCRSDRRSR